MYIVLSKLYNIRCTIYAVQYMLYNVLCTMYFVQCTLYNVRCTVYAVQCTVKPLITNTLEEFIKCRLGNFQ